MEDRRRHTRDGKQDLRDVGRGSGSPEATCDGDERGDREHREADVNHQTADLPYDLRAAGRVTAMSRSENQDPSEREQRRTQNDQTTSPETHFQTRSLRLDAALRDLLGRALDHNSGATFTTPNAWSLRSASIGSCPQTRHSGGTWTSASLGGRQAGSQRLPGVSGTHCHQHRLRCRTASPPCGSAMRQ